MSAEPLPLPIDPRLPEVVERLRAAPNLVLVAEPGAGKTTRVPRAMLDAGLAGDGEILVLEPRRLAARMAARRVAQEAGETVGGRIGYQVRFDDASSARTRVRFVTEGILTRRLATDPELRGVTAVVLDEFHERHLHADLGLALLRKLQRERRPELRLLAMSATMEADPVARFLGCEAMQVEGRTFEVSVEHAERPDDRPLERQVASAVRCLAREGLEGDVLVFLPGAAEIRRASEACAPVAKEAGLELAMLHGQLPPDEQDRAVRPARRPKVILSTNVAETSITIEGVVAVVDSGLARVAKHSPFTGLPRLETAQISQASAAQRAGRAGRVRPGRCIRLYTKHDHDVQPVHDTPEIQRADLAEPVLMLRAAGHDPATFPFFERPSEVALEAADALLERLHAVDAGGVTASGRRMLGLPLHPRLARLLLEAEAREATPRGCLLAALLGEREIRRSVRSPLGGGPARIDEVGASDLLARLEAFEDAERDGLGPSALRAHDLDVGACRAVARARDQLVRAMRADTLASAPVHEQEEALLLATLAGFPDRVGRRREPGKPEVVFAEGGSAKLADSSVVKEADLLVAVEADERRRGGNLIRTASAVEPEHLLELLPERIVDRRERRFDPTTERVIEVAQVTYEGLVLDESRRPAPADEETARVLADAALEAGLGRFCDEEALSRLQRRLAFAAEHGLETEVPDETTIREALGELCAGRTSFAELRDADLLGTLRARIEPKTLAALERFAPEHVSIPGRRRVPVRYEPGKPPWIASRLQDFFGMSEGPSVAGGRVPLVLHLLAPNRRAVQVTTDLAGFWERHYPALRKELGRRYPKHAWPQDPRTASPDRPGRRRK